MTTNPFPNLTPSRAAALSCLKRFHDEHVARLAPHVGFVPTLAYGIVVHETLRDVLNPIDPTPIAARDIAAFACRAVAKQNYPDSAARAIDLEKCIKTVTAYVAQSSATEETQGVEVYDALRITHTTRQPLTLGAKFDRLLIQTDTPHHLRGRDYKTGTPGTIDLDGATIMLAIAAVKFKEYSDYSVEYDYIDSSGLRERRTVTFADAKAAWPDLKARAQRVYNAEAFPAEPGEHCMFCPFRAVCQPDMVTSMDELDAILE